MAAPSFVSQTAFASGTGALTVAACASVVSGDVILLFVESANESVAAPAGYNTGLTALTGTSGAAGGMYLKVFWQVASGSDTTTAVADSGNHTAAVKIAYRNVYNAVPIAVAQQNYWNTATTLLEANNSLTVERSNSRVILAAGPDRDASSTALVSSVSGGANITGFAVRFQESTNAGAGGGIIIADGVLASPGQTGLPNITLSTASASVGLLIVLNEAPPPSNNTASINKAEPAVKDSFVADANVTAATELNYTFDTYHSANLSGTAFEDQYLPPPFALGTSNRTSLAVDVFISYAINASVLTDLTLNLTGLVRYRKSGDTVWIDAGAEQAQTQPAIIVANAHTQYGFIQFSRTITGLLTNTDYEFSLWLKFPTLYTSVWAVWSSGAAAASGFTASKIKVFRPNTATLSATEAATDTFVADAEVTGTGSGNPTGYVDATESGSDTFAADIEPFVVSTASLDATESGADTVVIKANEPYKEYFALHEVSVSGSGTSDQTRGHLIVNTLEYTSLRLNQTHHSLLYRPTQAGSAAFFSRMKVGWKYRMVGEPTWIVLTVGSNADTERNTSQGLWSPDEWPESSLQTMLTTFTGHPFVTVSGLLKNTEYEVMPTLRFDTETYALPPADCKAWAEDPIYAPFNDMRSTISATRRHGPLVISLTEPGADTFVADAVLSGNIIDAYESGPDVCQITASNISQASIVANEAGSDSAALGVANIAMASIGVQESGADTLAAAAFSQNTATADVAAMETGPDEAAITASVLCQAILSATENGADTASASALAIAAALIAAAEAGADTAAVLVKTPASASIAAQEPAGDTAAAAAKVVVTSSVSATEGGADVLTSDANAIATASLVASEAGSDTAAATADALVQAALAASELGEDTFSATALVIPITTATVYGVELGSDSVAAYAKTLAQAALSGIESGSDIIAGSVNVVASAILAAVESGQDSATAVAKAIVQAVMELVEAGQDGFEGAVGTIPHSNAYLYAVESGGDNFSASAVVYDSDAVVVVHKCPTVATVRDSSRVAKACPNSSATLAIVAEPQTARINMCTGGTVVVDEVE